MNIFDGELVLDKGKDIPTFLVFDALFLRETKSVMQLQFSQRLIYAATEVRQRFRKGECVDKFVGVSN